jgi:4-methylaminobutanoate oxidase (formaldehyde-forming)
MALAKGARQGGATIRENVAVTGVMVERGRAVGVRTAEGEVRAEAVVNCAGMWGREVGAMAGVNVPLHAAEHFYCVTEPMPGAVPTLPVLRDMDGQAYMKEDAGKLLIGAFELKAKPWGMDGIPADFEFGELPEDLDHFQPILEKAMRRVPALEKVGIRKFFNGPESFTPDQRYLLGEAPALDRFYVACGFNSIGIQSAGGAGKVLADWIVDGAPPFDLWDVDIRRMMPHQGDSAYLRARVSEALGLLYAMHWPHRQFATARDVRRSPLHARLAENRAVFGEVAGYERANWYAKPGQRRAYEYAYGRQNWFENAADECRAVRKRVGLIDQSSFAKFLLEGPDAEAVLQRLSANDVGGAVGRVVYTQWLNDKGGIEADLTVTKLAEGCFLVVTAAATAVRERAWLRRRMPAEARVTITDVTDSYATIGLHGPQARDVMAAASGADLSNAHHPYATMREILIGEARVMASRISYVGELGWELYVPAEQAVAVFDRLRAGGATLVGMHAMDCLRIEKAYRHWGHDITDEDTPLEAGLGFAVAWDKPGGFIGREALLRQKAEGIDRRLVQFLLQDPEPVAYGNEPIWRDGKLVGRTSSAAYGHTLGACVALGYVAQPRGAEASFILDAAYEIEIAKRRYPAKASLRPLWDPTGARMKI